MAKEKQMGRKLYNATVKKQFLKSCREYAIKLEGELKAVYSDPDTIVGKLSIAFQDAQTANKRLSVLTAAILKSLGGKVTITKEELESFKGMALNIKWEAPEGIKIEEATSYIFSYDAIPESPMQSVGDAIPEDVGESLEKTQQEIQAAQEASQAKIRAAIEESKSKVTGSTGFTGPQAETKPIVVASDNPGYHSPTSPEGPTEYIGFNEDDSSKLNTDIDNDESIPTIPQVATAA